MSVYHCLLFLSILSFVTEEKQSHGSRPRMGSDDGSDAVDQHSAVQLRKTRLHQIGHGPRVIFAG